MAQARGRGAWPDSALPLIGLGGFQLQVGIDSLVVALLAVGLNIVVGWAGILDLGYVAFLGFGAYGFALLSSAQIGSHGIHLWAVVSMPARDDRQPRFSAWLSAGRRGG